MSNETPARVLARRTPKSLRGWVDGDAGPLVSVSVEQHVLRCAHCRGQVAGLVPASTAVLLGRRACRSRGAAARAGRTACSSASV